MRQKRDWPHPGEAVMGIDKIAAGIYEACLARDEIVPVVSD